MQILRFDNEIPKLRENFLRELVKLKVLRNDGSLKRMANNYLE